MTDSVRIEAMFRTAMEVLRDSPEPLTKRQVTDAVASSFDFTPYENHRDRQGRPRWEVMLGWQTGNAATIGWIIKRDSRWSLTEAGFDALETYPGAKLYTEMARRHHEIRKQRQQAHDQLSGNEQLIADALAVVAGGVGPPTRTLPRQLTCPRSSYLTSLRTLTSPAHTEWRTKTAHCLATACVISATGVATSHNGSKPRAQRSTRRGVWPPMTLCRGGRSGTG